MTVHVRCCPVLIGLLSSPQSPERPVPIADNTSTLKVPGSNVTNWLPETVNVSMSGWALTPLTTTTDGGVVAHIGMLQINLINRVPVFSGVPVVFGTPLLTLFVALWLHEFDTWLSAPTVSQFAACLVSWFMSLESAKTAVGAFVVKIPATNIVFSRINTISVWLWRFVLFAQIVSISGLGILILS